MFAPAPGPAPLEPKDPLDPGTLRQLQDLGDDDPDFLPGVLRSFRDHATSAVATLEAAVRAGDTAAVKRAAHSLKGGAGNIGARDLSSRCAALEAATVGRGDLVAALGDVVAEARRVGARIDAELTGGRGRG